MALLPSEYLTGGGSGYEHFDLPTLLSSLEEGLNAAGISSYTHLDTTTGGSQGSDGTITDRNNPLGIPHGQAMAMPNRQKSDAPMAQKRASSSYYGGAGDSAHLGGFASGSGIDLQGISPLVWYNMVTKYNIKSVLDLGCGRGFSTSWFDTHGLRTLGVDGSSDSFRQSAIPMEKHPNMLVEHDFALGPWWPNQTYDAVWTVEFMEHVGINYMKHYLPVLRKAALIFMTTSRWGGYHHVEVHADPWWIRKFETLGFKYSEALTQEVRGWASQENRMNIMTPFAPGKRYNAQHVWLTMKVFINPVVASLPQHDHLFYEQGCFAKRENGEIVHRECGINEESKIPESYKPIQLTSDMDKTWESLVLHSLGVENNTTAPDVQTKTVDNMAQTTKTTTKTTTSASVALAPQELPELLKRIKTRDFNNMPTIPVVAWPYVSFGIKTAEHKHIEENGITESPRLRLSNDLNDLDPNVVWVGDTGWGAGWNKWCGEFMKKIQETMHLRISKGLPPRWPIFIVDFTDQAGFQRCRSIEQLMGKEYVRYTTRSVGKNRRWVDNKQWVSPGFYMNLTMADGLTYQHTPLVVRTDTIESLKESLTQQGLDLAYPIENLPRSTDAIHLWPVNSTKVNAQYGKLRTKVSEILTDMGHKHNISTFVGLAGKPLREGRRGVENAYVEMLLNTKIVVVAQRDNWEDHYRLMEALISGACVFTDFMHGMPQGLRNGTSIVEYSSEQEFRQLLLHYLNHDEERIAIGRNGREVAMMRHRTWHRIEEVIFGEILTTCETKAKGGKCPYIVHGDENR
jgi:SAM-dependent methyltransferase